MSHKRKKLRLSGYDYSQPGDYFVTICTKNMKKCFGAVAGENVKLSDIGRIVKRCWVDIPNHFGNTELDEHIIMPNHVHGIVRIMDSVEVADLRPLRDDKNTKGQFDRSKCYYQR